MFQLIKPTQWLVLAFLLVSIFFSVSPTFAQTETYLETTEGIITKVISTGKETFRDELAEYQELEITLTQEKNQGEKIVVKHFLIEGDASNPFGEEYQLNDKVKLVINQSETNEKIYTIDGKIKRDSLITLGIIFIVVVVVVGRIWGAFSLVGLSLSFLVIFKLIIPLIIRGTNPVLAAVLGAMLIVPITFYISHGFNTKTHIGVITTIVSLIFTGLLAVYFVEAAHLTGFASEEAGFLQIERSGTIDIRGLLLAGIIIGTLGILDDVTIGQSSTVQQLKKANPKMKLLELYTNGMKVGQDHISSMVNTLMLVYSGSALPLLLLFFGSQKSFLEILEYELIAEEIVRMLVGSIGLVLAAPLATILAAYFFSARKTLDSPSL